MKSIITIEQTLAKKITDLLGRQDSDCLSITNLINALVKIREICPPTISVERNQQMNIKEKLSLLEKAVWDYKDISAYLDCGETTACKYKKDAVKNYKGEVKYMSNKVRSDAVLELLGSTREREIDIIRKSLELQSALVDEDKN